MGVRIHDVWNRMTLGGIMKVHRLNLLAITGSPHVKLLLVVGNEGANIFVQKNVFNLAASSVPIVGRGKLLTEFQGFRHTIFEDFGLRPHKKPQLLNLFSNYSKFTNALILHRDAWFQNLRFDHLRVSDNTLIPSFNGRPRLIFFLFLILSGQSSQFIVGTWFYRWRLGPTVSNGRSIYIVVHLWNFLIYFL